MRPEVDDPDRAADIAAVMIPRPVHAVLALVFAFGAALQYNDPDPLVWMLVWGAAALVAALAAFRRAGSPRSLALIVAVIALVWAAVLGSRAVGRVPLARMFESWRMKDAQVEENRETFGLVLIGAWMLVVAFVPTRRRRGGIAG